MVSSRLVGWVGSRCLVGGRFVSASEWKLVGLLLVSLEGLCERQDR